jgi:hypothetical protein
MDHKAYAFDWNCFAGGLLDLIVTSLGTGDAGGLTEYIDANREYLKDPYEGEPLDEDWREQLGEGDVQELADYALTRFYEASQNAGLAEEWLRLSDTLPEAAQAALLGRPVGPDDCLFDPGRMGSYFRTPDDVLESIGALEEVDLPELAEYRRLLEACKDKGLVLYVTF